MRLRKSQWSRNSPSYKEDTSSWYRFSRSIADSLSESNVHNRAAFEAPIRTFVNRPNTRIRFGSGLWDHFSSESRSPAPGFDSPSESDSFSRPESPI